MISHTLGMLIREIAGNMIAWHADLTCVAILLSVVRLWQSMHCRLMICSWRESFVSTIICADLLEVRVQRPYRILLKHPVKLLNHRHASDVSLHKVAAYAGGNQIRGTLQAAKQSRSTHCTHVSNGMSGIRPVLSAQVAVRSEEPYRLQGYSILKSLSAPDYISDPDVTGSLLLSIRCSCTLYNVS